MTGRTKIQVTWLVGPSYILLRDHKGDNKNELVKVYEDLPDGLNISRSDYMKGIIERNHIENPNKIRVGQLLKMSDY